MRARSGGVPCAHADLIINAQTAIPTHHVLTMEGA